MRTFALQWSLHGVYATARAQRYCVSPSQMIDRSIGRRSTEAKPRFCGRILSAPRKKDRESGTKTQNRQGFVCCWDCWSGYDAKTAKFHFVGLSHEYDEWRDNDNKRNYFLFVRLEKMFFPEEGSLEDKGNIFRGQLYRCLIPSISSQLYVQEQILWSLPRPLKWYKLKSCGNK